VSAARPSPVRAVVAGICGYGASYVRALLTKGKRRRVELVGCVDPHGQDSALFGKLTRRGIEVFPTLAAFYERASADLAVLASPIHAHADQTAEALACGSAVLCEKPAAATIGEVRSMMAAAASAARPVAVGFQRSFSPAVQALKRDVLAGLLGRPKRLVAMANWPRPRSYYDRNDWAGKLRARSGAWVLDSPANNATAHFLHSMLYLLGPARTQAATPAEVQAELYRAKPIENYDTAAIRVRLADGAEVLFLTSHSTETTRGPVLRYEFEEATVRYDKDGKRRLVAEFRDGRRKRYGDPEDEHFNKLWQTAGAARICRDGGGPADVVVDCPIDAALPHTQCVNAAQASGEVVTFPDDLLCVTGQGGDALVWVRGLQEVLGACFERFTVPSKLGEVAWARAGRAVDISTCPAEPAIMR